MPKARNASQVHAEPLKYEPVPIVPILCTLEELETHLRGFIKGFIAEEAQERWLEYLVEQRPLWFALEARPRNMKVLRKVDMMLNNFYFQEQYVRMIQGADTFPLSLAGVYGTALGVYFDPHTAPCKMTAAEAATKTTGSCIDAILSFVPGKKAISFHHEGGVWICER